MAYLARKNITVYDVEVGPEIVEVKINSRRFISGSSVDFYKTDCLNDGYFASAFTPAYGALVCGHTDDDFVIMNEDESWDVPFEERFKTLPDTEDDFVQLMAEMYEKCIEAQKSQ